MSILHLTDSHYSDEKTTKTKIETFVKKICDDGLNKSVDLLFFTGDIVFNGETVKDFQSAKALILDPIIQAFSVDPNNLMISQDCAPASSYPHQAHPR